MKFKFTNHMFKLIMFKLITPLKHLSSLNLNRACTWWYAHNTKKFDHSLLSLSLIFQRNRKLLAPFNSTLPKLRRGPEEFKLDGPYEIMTRRLKILFKKPLSSRVNRGLRDDTSRSEKNDGFLNFDHLRLNRA